MRRPPLSSKPVVQAITVTSDRAASIREITGRIPRSFGCGHRQAHSVPAHRATSYEQMADQLLAQAREYGITSYVVREPAIPHMEHVLALLRPGPILQT